MGHGVGLKKSEKQIPFGNDNKEARQYFQVMSAFLGAVFAIRSMILGRYMVL